jgi:hypothetical protein
MPQLSEKYGKQNKPFMVAEDDAYQSLIGSDPTHATQLAAIARREYPSGKGIIGFDEMNPTEKDLLKKHIAYNLMQSGIDANPAYATSITKTPKQNVNITNAAPLIQDNWADIVANTTGGTLHKLSSDKKHKDYEIYGLDNTSMSTDSQKSIIQDANLIKKGQIVLDKNGDPAKDTKGNFIYEKFDNNNLAIINENGQRILYARKYNAPDEVDFNQRIGALSKYGINSKVNTTAKQKQQLLVDDKKNASKTKDNNPAEAQMITVVMPDGTQGQIPKSTQTQFLKDYPKAKIVK